MVIARRLKNLHGFSELTIKLLLITSETMEVLSTYQDLPLML